MVYNKDSEGWPNVGRYFACRRIYPNGKKGPWLEPLGSIQSDLNDPEMECIMYDDAGDQLPN